MKEKKGIHLVSSTWDQEAAKFEDAAFPKYF